jgi:3-oxoacyl-[acyl-carrier-protein] synthase-3
MGSDGAGCENLIVYGSGARGLGDGQSNGLHMDGSQVFMFTMDMVPKCVEALLDKADLTSADVDQYVFHQASKLVIDNIVRRLDLEEGQVFRNYEQIGNTVSASIPIALKDAIDGGRIRQDDTVMLVGFGVGYSWGGCLLRGGFSV